jgi:hypothetical protein
MKKFVLIDLYDQRNEVLLHVLNWRKDEILEWMQESGTVTKIDSDLDENLYIFESRSGSRTAFRFSETNSLIIFHGR